MLALSRREGEAIVVTGNAKITVYRIGPGNHVTLAIDAPKSVQIWREELLTRVAESEKGGDDDRAAE